MIQFFSVMLLLLGVTTVFAKTRNGESFRILNGFTFSQLDNTNDLNSLQILASPLAGEPFSTGVFPKSPPHISNDQPQSLIDVFDSSFEVIKDITALNRYRNGLLTASLWSPHHFSTSKGGIAYRYQLYEDQDLGWEELYLLNLSSSAPDLIAKGMQNMLSPMEKYELLIGNFSFDLSSHEWKKGLDYFNRFKEVPSWIGLCHGSAPASFMAIEPKKSIHLKLLDGSLLTFTPSDLKALITFSWAQSGGPSALMGSRCGKHLQHDIRAGLNCRDTNPASFHAALINVLGIHQKPMIMDSSAGPEVWNKVVQSFRYHFFRPGTRNLTSNFLSSVIALESWKNDPYRPYRSSQAKQIVGVNMEVSYLIEAKITPDGQQSTAQFETISYWYDLEIDSRGHVIGGEWHSQIHPDFVWVVAENFQPQTIFDVVLRGKFDRYNGSTPLSPFIRSQAMNAARNGEILFELTNALLKISQ